MAEEFKLNVVTCGEQKASKIRKSGKIPAIVYGNDFNNVKVSVSNLIFNRLFTETGESSLINLKINNNDSIKVLVHEIQIDPVTMEPIHIDFYKVNMKEKIKTEIPLKQIGESSAVVDLEGSLVTNRHEVEVQCLPTDLIPEIEVDISVLKTFDDVVKVSDLKVPEGIEILDDLEEVVFLVQPPRSEEELAELEEKPEEDVEAVEVEGEKLEEGEETAAPTSEESESESRSESVGKGASEEPKPVEEKKE